MADLDWQGEGPAFTIDRAGRSWTLRLDQAQPCLSWSDGRSVARLLGLDHVATIGRRDESAFDGSSLVSFERYRHRVQATFAPPGWDGLSVRAAWGPAPIHEGFDLEVQVSTTSTGVLHRLEVAIASTWSNLARGPGPTAYYYVEPRDVRAAALSYDGREPADLLRSFLTMPVPDSSPHTLPPDCYPLPGPAPDPDRCYMEMVQPSDCARRIFGEEVTAATAPYGAVYYRYGLFGHDLEKGVVLRGRIRGVWIPCNSTAEEKSLVHEAFLREPPALGP